MIARPGRAAVALGLALATIGPVTALAGCAVSEIRTVEGLVVDVVSDSPGRVERFTLRTDDGMLVVFVVGDAGFGHGGFPATHLREHQALAERVRVTYRVEGSGGGERLIVVRLEDVT